VRSGLFILFISFKFDTYLCIAFDGYVSFGIVFLTRVVGKAALARISCLWFHCRAYQRISGEKLGSESS
jgi:hypothetical protein